VIRYANTDAAALDARSTGMLRYASKVVCALHAKSLVDCKYANSGAVALDERSARVLRCANTVVCVLHERSVTIRKCAKTGVKIINVRLLEEGARLNMPITTRLGPIHPKLLLLVSCLSLLEFQRFLINGYF
jgi:hypothetical protein